MEAASEEACKVAEANYAKDPSDAYNLAKWGKALFQLSRFHKDSKKMREDAILKLKEALEIDPLKHDTIWLLGKCFTVSALKTPDPDEVQGYLHKALGCFQRVLRGDPGNGVYLRSVQQVTKELERYKDIHTIAFDKLSIGAASSEAKAPEMDKEFHTNVEVDKHMNSNAETDMDIHSNVETDVYIHNNEEMDKNIHSNAEMDNELCTNVEMGMDIRTNVEMDKGIHTNAEMDIDSKTNVETDKDKDKDIHTNTEMNMDIRINAEMDKGI